MSPLISRNEIRSRAIVFSNKWEKECSEDAEAKSFWDDFFYVFDVSRKRVASFEEPVKKLGDKQGFIDLFWKGKLIVEHKSRGKNLDKAYTQALDYFNGLKDYELPKYVLVSDFATFRLYNLEENTIQEFLLENLNKNIHLFNFISGYEVQKINEQDPVNIRAAELMGKLHDKMKENGYEGHCLELYLVRLLFCLFAEDTEIFNKQQFFDYIIQRTSEDGSDLGAHLSILFQTLNTPKDKRLKNIDEQLSDFEYINGKLFAENLPFSSFDKDMRSALLNCCTVDWSKISPAIFGSLFQSIMKKDERRNLGAHYTSEKNILKLIKPLFLDELRSEFENLRSSKKKLMEFHKKLRALKFLDPACGCGNFLVIAYRELRLLELDVLISLHKNKPNQLLLDIRNLILVDVDQFYGIEIEEFPAQIAQVALWLIDHQMNTLVSLKFGLNFARIPLARTGNITCQDALSIDWTTIIEKNELNYIMGNPPFIGSKFLNEFQRKNLNRVLRDIHNNGVLDFVAGWYVLAAKFIKDTSIKCAFVSTNSICQGEQVGILWEYILDLEIKIYFAHRTFRWSNEATGKAAVHCIIVGFSHKNIPTKFIYEYDDIAGDPHSIPVKTINPYLVDAPNILLKNRKKPICKSVPHFGIGNKPIDGGNYLFTTQEKNKFISEEPESSPYFHRWIGADEFLNGYERWCLWLGDCPPEKLKKLPKCLERIDNVRKFRLASKSKPTQKLAQTPTNFHVENMPNTDILVIPEVSSERRTYIPIGFEASTTFCSNLLKIAANATLYHFGILSSLMHNSWVRYVGGRLKSDYRYSTGIIYNNFPWPQHISTKHKENISNASEEILTCRKNHNGSTLADLYDPLSMPKDLLKAHHKLDRLVDKAYAKKFTSETERVGYLFELHDLILKS